MERKVVLVALALALLLALAGCNMTPRQKLVSGYQSYRAVATLMIKARRDRVIESDTVWAQILKIDSIVYEALTAYAESIEMGRPDEAAWEAFNAALDQLLEIYQRLPEPVDKPTPDPAMQMEVM